MKILLLSTALSLMLAVSPWAAENVRIDGAQFDFGQVPANATLTHRVWIHAVGTDTLRLSEVKTGCGCLTAPLAADTILPGDSLSLVFYWQTRGLVGNRNQSAYLYIRPGSFPYEILLKGNVVTPEARPASVSWSPAIVVLAGAPGVGLSGSFGLANQAGEKLTDSLVEAGPGIALEIPATVDSGQSIVGQVKVGKEQATIRYEGSVTLELTGNRSQACRVSIPVQFGDFSFRPVFTTKKK